MDGSKENIAYVKNLWTRLDRIVRKAEKNGIDLFREV